MNNTNENNKIIAEFMGPEWHKDFFKDVCIISTSNISYKFDISWDWLMPVIEKIESLGYEVQIRSTDCIIFQLLDTLDYKPIIGTISSASGKMYSTYIAVVEFIKDQKDRKDGLKK